MDTATIDETTTEVTTDVGAEVAMEAAPSPDHTMVVKRMSAMQKLGEAIKLKDRERDMQETEVAEAESALKGERSTLNKIVNELDELHADLAKLAVGEQIDKLPFAGTPAGDVAEVMTATPDAWRAVPLADTGIPAKLVTTLADAGFDTLGKLADHSARQGLLTDIKGIGPAKAEAIEAALANYWKLHPEHGCEVKAATTALTWAEDVDEPGVYRAENTAGIRTDGAVVASGASSWIAMFCIQSIEDEFVIDRTDGVLFSRQEHSAMLPTLDAAKAFCERVNAGLVAEGKGKVDPAAFKPVGAK